MKITRCTWLCSILITCNTIQSSQNSSATPEEISQALVTLSTSDNPALNPLKDVLGDLGNHALSRRSGPDFGAAAPGVTQNVALHPPKTPFNTPSKPRNPSKKQRPTPIRAPRAHDAVVGLGNLNLSPFKSLPDQHSESPKPLLQEEIDHIHQSITKLEALSGQLLDKKNQLSADEQKAVEYIQKNSKQALYANPTIIGATALAMGAGALAWAARINPFRIYQKECTKFTGLEFPALLAAGKALIGPVVAIIGIGILWYKFKQWVVEPYRQAHQTDIERFQQALAKHKTEVHEALITTQKQTDETHRETMAALTAIKKAVDENLAKLEQTTRKQLEHTLKEVSQSEQQLNQSMATLSQQLKSALATHTADLGTLKNDVRVFRQTNEDMRQKVELAMQGQTAALQLVRKIREDSEKLKQILSSKNIITPSPTSPASAPAGHRSPSPGPLSLSIPHSAQITGTERRKWFGRSSKIAPSPSAGLSPLPELPGHLRINTQSPGEGESKRAPISAPTPVTTTD